jgi:hypothetical protein
MILCLDGGLIGEARLGAPGAGRLSSDLGCFAGFGGRRYLIERLAGLDVSPGLMAECG